MGQNRKLPIANRTYRLAPLAELGKSPVEETYAPKTGPVRWFRTRSYPQL